MGGAAVEVFEVRRGLRMEEKTKKAGLRSREMEVEFRV